MRRLVRLHTSSGPYLLQNSRKFLIDAFDIASEYLVFNSEYSETIISLMSPFCLSLLSLWWNRRHSCFFSSNSGV